MTTLALIHTGTFLAAVFTDLCHEAMPDVDVFNMVDESLIKNTIAANKLTAPDLTAAGRSPEICRRGGGRRNPGHLLIRGASGGGGAAVYQRPCDPRRRGDGG